MKLQRLYQFLGVALFLCVALVGAPASADIYYTNNFDTPVFTVPGVLSSITGGANDPTVAPYDVSFGNIYRSDSSSVPIELTLTNLPAHTHVDVNFFLAFLESWDSDGGGGFGPDNLNVSIDGNLIGTYTYNNALGSLQQIGGGALLYEYVQLNGNGYFSDTMAIFTSDPAYFIPHTASSLTVQWIASGNGWQGGTDEAYAIENVIVALHGVTVPEPASILLTGVALSSIALFARRRA